MGLLKFGTPKMVRCCIPGNAMKKRLVAQYDANEDDKPDSSELECNRPGIKSQSLGCRELVHMDYKSIETRI